MAENIQSIKQHRVDWLKLLSRGLSRVRRTLRVWHERRRGRRLLAQLPPYLLKDIGITGADRYEETSKPFWKD